jgi:hypothetical protein
VRAHGSTPNESAPEIPHPSTIQAGHWAQTPTGPASDSPPPAGKRSGAEYRIRFRIGQTIGQEYLFVSGTHLKKETYSQTLSAKTRFVARASARITGLPERSARRILNDVVAEGLLASATQKGPVSVRFPTDSLEVFFFRLYVQA